MRPRLAALLAVRLHEPRHRGRAGEGQRLEREDRGRDRGSAGRRHARCLCVKRLGGVDRRRRHARSGSGIGNAAVERRYDRHGAAERARQRREVGFADKGGLRTSNREVADASDRDRRRRHIRAGGSLLATWRNGLCRCRLTLRRQRLIRVQRRRRPCGARPRHAACPWRRRDGQRPEVRHWGRLEPAPTTHPRRTPAPRAGSRLAP